MLPVEQVLIDSVHVVRIHRFALRERIVIIAQAGQHFYLRREQRPTGATLFRIGFRAG